MPTVLIGYGLVAVTIVLGITCMIPSPYQGILGAGAFVGGAACAAMSGWLGRWLASVGVIAGLVLLTGCGEADYPVSGALENPNPPRSGGGGRVVVTPPPVRPEPPVEPPGEPPAAETPFASLADATKQASVPGIVVPLTDDVVTVTIRVLGDPEWFTVTDWANRNHHAGYATAVNKPYVEVLYTSTAGDRRLVAFEAFPGAIHQRLVPGFDEVLPIERLKAGYTFETLGNACVSMTNIIGDYEGWSFTRRYGIINEDGHAVIDDDPTRVTVYSQGVLWVPPTRKTPMTATAREGNFTPWNMPEGDG